MFRGIYNGAAAMLVQQNAVDVAANNLSNANTSGFRKRVVACKSFPECEMVRIEKAGSSVSRKTSLGGIPLSVVVSECAAVMSHGDIRETGNPLECAISGEGFFQVTNGQDIFYTRSGDFTLDGEGHITTTSGFSLMGDGGPLIVGEETRLSITEDGTVLADGEEIGRIALFNFESPSYMHQIGSNLFAQTEASGVPLPINSDDTRLVPGYIEGSNVNVVEEMTRMLTASRAYEAVSKAFEAGSETGKKMIETFGR
ncbi:MAG: flagellar basal-body rod protein FlgF [Thermovirga sp.]